MIKRKTLFLILATFCLACTGKIGQHSEIQKRKQSLQELIELLMEPAYDPKVAELVYEAGIDPDKFMESNTAYIDEVFDGDASYIDKNRFYIHVLLAELEKTKKVYHQDWKFDMYDAAEVFESLTGKKAPFSETDVDVSDDVLLFQKLSETFRKEGVELCEIYTDGDSYNFIAIPIEKVKKVKQLAENNYIEITDNLAVNFFE